MKEIYVFLDESGHIHKNSSCRYFAIGGWCCCAESAQKIKALYKRRNKSIKKRNHLELSAELKARDMTEAQKIDLISAVQCHDDFCGIGITFDKTRMYKKIESENIFFNYGVRVLFDDIIFNLVDMSEEVRFSIFCDNRNLRVDDLKDLEKESVILSV